MKQLAMVVCTACWVEWPVVLTYPVIGFRLGNHACPRCDKDFNVKVASIEHGVVVVQNERPL